MATLTFTEKIGIWITAGALLVSGTPAAAIAFLTVAPSFVVAMRTGNLGGIITWYLDGDPVAVVDTHSDEPGIVEVALVGNPELDEHQLYAVKDDDPDTIAEIVRKELTENEVQPPNTRYDATCDCVQVTTDGGATWTDAPGLDPRSQPGYLAPARTSDNPQCDAAANMVNAVRLFLDSLNDDLTAWGIATALLAFLANLFLPFGLIVSLVVAIADLIFAGELSAWKAAMTDAVYEQLLCILFANIESDGTVTQGDYDAIYEQVGTDLPSTAAGFVQLMLTLTGYVGLSNAGTTGTEVGDCSSCAEWCWQIDFTATDGGFAAQTGDDPGDPWIPALGTYSGGTGWVSTLSARSTAHDRAEALEILLHVPAGSFTQVVLYADITFGQSIPDIRGTVISFNDDTQSFSGEGSGQIFTWHGSDAGDSDIILQTVTGYHGSSVDPSPTGSVIFTKVVFSGNGTNPFGTDNCI